MGSVVDPTPVQLHIYVQKKPDMTYDQFHDYWVNNHGKTFVDMSAVKRHCIKYEIVSTLDHHGSARFSSS